MMKKKNKAKLIIAILIIIFLISTFLYLFFRTDFFRTKRSAFLRYFETIPESIELLSENNFSEYNNKKKDTPFIRKATVKIQDSSNIANSEILDRIKLEINEKTDNKNKKSNIEYDIYNGNNKLANISYIQNKDTIGLFSEDVVRGYICVDNNDLQRIINDTNGTKYVLPNQVNFGNVEKILEISKNEKNKIAKVYKNLSDDVPNTAYTKERNNQVTINNKIYTGTAYTLTLNPAENAKLEEALLTQVSQNSILMDCITSKAKLIGFDNEYSSINDLNKLMKDKIAELQQNPESAGNLQIKIHQFKQQNIETEINVDNINIVIQHVKSDADEYSSIQIGDEKFSVQKTGNYYTFGYTNEKKDESIIIDYSQTGSVENNDIKNSMTIKHNSGIKRITYLYNDEIDFTKDIGQIKDFEGTTTVKLNEMKDNELSAFMKLLKNRINDVYISKGAGIGINLDPIFVYE